jgi:cobalt-precorrin 5A hydrolase/precorrin-3B C17-methyltransferase
MTAVVVLGPSGLAVATAIRAAVSGARIHGLATRVDGMDETFVDTMAHLRVLFSAGVPIVGVCAAGILIRAVAPLLADKTEEPAVVAVSEDGMSVVPLLGGHRGANRLAATIAAATGGRAALTTAGDVSLGVALDEPPPGWRIADAALVKPTAAALLAGEPVSLTGCADWLAPLKDKLVPDGGRRIVVTDGIPSGDSLTFHPPLLAVGVGCERGATVEEVATLIDSALRTAGLSPAAVACIASLDVKMDEPAVLAAAERFGWPLRFFDAAALEAETPRLANPSDTVFAAVGCHGVAEAAALAAAGKGARLVVEKTKSSRATCAVARAIDDIEPARVGRARGRLVVVGIGPGSDGWRTPEASRELSEAEDVVGYGLYLDLIARVIAGKCRHESALSEEEARVRKALDLAAEGKRVALVSSGDAGIYALAALVFELLDREDRPAWNRIEIKVAPGVSALQAAAARIGAPLGHDFCAISLSDLLTPWPDIERRLRAAAEGDFIVALYNPASRRRQEQLGRARDLLLAGRPAETPVILARNLGRAGEAVQTITLGELVPERVDMLTLVLIGSSRTRLIRRGAGHWVYTPRGYEKKAAR